MNTSNVNSVAAVIADAPVAETVPSPASLRHDAALGEKLADNIAAASTVVVDAETASVPLTLYHTFKDGVQMWIGGGMHKTGCRFTLSDGSSPLNWRENYAGYEEELKAEGKTMTPLRDAQEAAKPKPIKLKYALCIPAWQRFVPRSLWTPTMRDRYGPEHFCEKDPSYLQLLPYITLRLPSGALFSYERGKGGDEAGLHDLVSMGVGGHMDAPFVVAPGEDPAQALDNHIIAEAIREIEEEVGYTPSEEVMRQALAQSFLMYFPKTDVDAVHLALSLTIEVPEPHLLTKMEAGVILNPRWMDRSFANLHSHVASMVKPEALLFKFETWTETYLGITRDPEITKAYRQGLKEACWGFQARKILVDLFQAQVPPVDNAPRLRMDVSARGHALVASLDGGQTWFATNPPLSTLIDKLEVSEEGGRPLYTFYSQLAERAISTQDFFSWTQRDFATGELKNANPQAQEAA